MKLLKHGWKFLHDSKNAGKYVGLPYNVIDYTKSDLTERVRILLQEFDCPYILESDDSAEDLLEELNGEIEEYEGSFMDMVLPIDGSEEYFLQFSQNIIIHVSTSDEYYGRGHNETHTCIAGMIVADEVTNGEVIEAVEWIKKFN